MKTLPLHAALFLLLLSTTCAQSRKPELRWNPPAPLFTAAKGSPLHNYRGLLVRSVRVRSTHPILPIVFFDSGSAAIPSRYHRFGSAAETAGFDETAIPGNTLEKYYHLLNVIGSRMKNNPETRVMLEGSSSAEMQLREDKAVAQQRAQVVVDYLTTIWGIAPARIEMRVGNPPWSWAAQKDPLGRIEYRRVEITIADPADSGYPLARPVTILSEVRRAFPDSAHFQLSNGIPDNDVSQRFIEVRRKGEIWALLSDSSGGDAMGWDWRNETGMLPEDRNPSTQPEEPFLAQLVVVDRDGREHRSNSVQIPVVAIQSHEWRTENDEEYGSFEQELIQFEYDSPMPGRLNERILGEFVHPHIHGTSRVTATGRTDPVGLEDRNMVLSQRRAETVIRGIRSRVRRAPERMESVGRGEGDPIYSNALPEGRFYNRSVVVRVVTPP